MMPVSPQVKYPGDGSILAHPNDAPRPRRPMSSGRALDVLVLMPYLQEAVPGQRFRIEQWARAVGPPGASFHFVPFQSPKLGRILHSHGHHVQKVSELVRCFYQRLSFLQRLRREWDVIFLHRELTPIGPPVLEKMLARKGIPIVYDFDDAIFLPNVSEANRRYRWLKWHRKTATICRLSSHVIVGNRYLQEYARKYVRDKASVSVIPSTIDTDVYTPKDCVKIASRPVIGWSGSLTTLKHLRLLEGVLKTLRKSVDFRLKVIGSKSFSIPGVDVEAKHWSASSEIEDLKSLDVGVMPLPDDAWSNGKCGLKALQYMAVGVPTLASPVGVNSEIIQDGRNGFLPASEREWVEKLALLLSSKDLRERFAKEGRVTVENHYSAKVQAPRVLEILARARQAAHASTAPAQAPLNAAETDG